MLFAFDIRRGRHLQTAIDIACANDKVVIRLVNPTLELLVGESASLRVVMRALPVFLQVALNLQLACAHLSLCQGSVGS